MAKIYTPEELEEKFCSEIAISMDEELEALSKWQEEYSEQLCVNLSAATYTPKDARNANYIANILKNHRWEVSKCGGCLTIKVPKQCYVY